MLTDAETDLIRRALQYFARVSGVKRPRSKAAMKKALELSERISDQKAQLPGQ